MKRNKIIATILSFVMCISILTPSIEVMADESSAPSETQNAEATEQQKPKNTEKQDTKANKDKGPESTKASESKATEETKQTEKKEPEVNENQESKPTEKKEFGTTDRQETEPYNDESSEAEKNNLPKTSTKESDKITESNSSGSGEKEPVDTAEEENKKDSNEGDAIKGTIPSESDKKSRKNGVIDSGTCGDNLTWSLDGTGALTISGNGTMTSWTKTDDVPWNSYFSDIKSVVFTGNVTSIGAYAFSTCVNLISIDLPNGLEQIGKCAFSGCSSLTSIVIPNTVTHIYNSAFEECTKLEKITLNESENILRIYPAVFKGCASLTSIILPKNVNTIDYYLFQGCSNLKSITINNTVYDIGNYAFEGCENLESIELPKMVTRIGDYAFSGCKKLECIVLPESVSYIGMYAFYNCTNLDNIKIPDGVNQIKKGAFHSCTSLSKISFPDNPITYESTVFYKCTSLSSVDGIKIVGTKLPSSFFKYSGIKHFSVPDNITRIEEEAFYSCEKLTSVEISSGVTYIGDYVFSYSGLLSIYIPKNVNKINSYAFNYCERLSSIVFEEKGEMYNTGDTVNDVGSFLKGCTRLANVAFAKDELKEKNLTSEAKNVIHYYFNVYYSDDGHGTVTGKTRSCASDTIEVVVTPDEGYELDMLKLTYPLPATEILSDANGKYIVTLPLTANGADIEATFKKTDYYRITVSEALNGTVTASPTKARAGEDVTITAIPNEGYYLVGIKVNGSYIEGTTFKMPSASVTVEAEFSILKDNTLKATGGKTAKIKYKKLRKKAQPVSRSKLMTVSTPQGKVTYKLVSVSKKKSYFKINASNGTVTVKKKLKKGTYTLKVNVTAAGNGEYKPATKTVTFKIKVK